MTKKRIDKKPTILIVDDEVINLNILADAFKEDYKLLVTKSGAQGLTRALQHDVDLILLDIMLPDMDGFEVCKRLKANEKTRNVPIIFITSRTQSTDEELGLHAGAVDYIGKPFNLPIVIARVETHIALKQKTDLLEEMAMLDGLTHLYNRRKFDIQFAIEFKRALRDGSALSLAMVDIDYFKLYNDHYGHAAGDKALKLVADRLNESIKRSCDMAARFGGEEFILILPNTDALGAAEYCQQLIDLFNERQIPHSYSPVAKHLTLSIGGATFINDKTMSQEDVFERVDKALYEAKNGGRNRLVWA
ncbi:MAG: diguanylate cyclase [Psychrosphaera sp.]|nr:diguanylate cyclase [Psychrosphaera sp.]